MGQCAAMKPLVSVEVTEQKVARTNRPRIGRFEVLARLGRGLQGKVYLGWDPRLQRKVALKVLSEVGQDIDSQEVVAEARIAARIAHPSVVPVFEADVYRGVPVIIFEYVDGVTLKEKLADHGPYPEADAISLLVRVAAGLKCAHEKGVVHLDISPNNILIDKDNRPHIMDFGLARLNVMTDKQPGDQTVAGTPRYMSPEHFNEAELTPATDVFALGLVCYEFLTGTPAMNQQSIAAIIAAVQAADIDWSRLQARSISPELSAILRDMLQADPSARYPSAVELVPCIDEVIKAQQGGSSADLALQFLLRRLQRKPEFPAFSHNIAEINRVITNDTDADFEKLGAIILRDYSLTNRLMKVANSAFFGRGNGGVKTVSQAVARLGLRTVRMICNGLLFFGQDSEPNEELQDAMTASFIAGLLARHLASKVSRELSEEAFICGLFHHLGRNLLMYYLRDEYLDICDLVRRGTPELQAEREVLGTTTPAVGIRIAEKWKFPDSIVQTMAPLPEGVLEAANGTPEIQRYLANFANELCRRAVTNEARAEPLGELEHIRLRYVCVYSGSTASLNTLLGAALQKFVDIAPSLGVDIEQSAFCRKLFHFVKTAHTAVHTADAEVEAAN